MHENRKRIVLDANILIRGVLGTKVREIIEKYASEVQFLTPDVCYQDAKKYLPPLLEKRNLSALEAIVVLESLTAFIDIVDSDLYNLRELEAKQRIAIRDVDDWPIIATALLIECPIWTEDADFFGAGVATWTSDRIHLYLSF